MRWGEKCEPCPGKNTHQVFNCKLFKKKKSAAQSWEQMSSEALQKLVRIIWSFASEYRLNYKPRITWPTYAVLLKGKKKKPSSARKTLSEVWPHIILTELIFRICISLFKLSVYSYLLMSLLKHCRHCPCFTDGEMEGLLTEFLWIGSRYSKRKRYILWQVCKGGGNLPVSGSPVFYPVSHWKTVRKDSYITSTTNDMRIFFKLLLKLAPRRLLFMQKIFLNFQRKVKECNFCFILTVPF